MKTVKIDNYIMADDFWDFGFVTPQLFAAQLNDGPDDDVVVEINSGGGLAFVAFQFVNSLLQYRADGRGSVTTRITGMAASAAAVVFLAGEEREVYKLSYFMQHRSGGGVYGDQDDMRSAADLLSQIDEITAADLAVLTGRSPKKMAELLRNEYNLVGGEKIVAEGIATNLIEGVALDPAKLLEQNKEIKPQQLASAMNINQYQSAIKPLFAEPEPKPTQQKNGLFGQIFNKKKEVEQVTEQEHEQALAEQKAALEQANADSVKQERERVQEIIQMAGGMTEPAQKAIAEGVDSAEFAKQQLLANPQQKQAPTPPAPKNDDGIKESIPSLMVDPPVISEEEKVLQQVKEAEKESKVL